MKKIILLILIVNLTGCASQSLTGNAYTGTQARQAQIVKMGKIVKIKSIQIAAGSSGVGGVAGAGLGAVAGSNIGGGDGRAALAGAIAGAVIGGVVGNMADAKLNTLEGQEITVKLENGTLLAVAQEIDKIEGAFSVGEQVSVLTSPTGITRITR
jgi:outer membrane lipoprotein SlyB